MTKLQQTFSGYFIGSFFKRDPFRFFSSFFVCRKWLHVICFHSPLVITGGFVTIIYAPFWKNKTKQKKLMLLKIL